MNFELSILGAVNGPSNLTQTAGTVITGIVRPYPGVAGGGNFLQKPNKPNKSFGRGVTHITTVLYTNGSTAHLVQICRPFNYTWLTTAIAANSGTAVLFDDPGKYSTNYKYFSPLSTGSAQIADNLIAANHFVVIQLADGTWFLSKITSVSTLTLTLTTTLPNITGGGALVGAPVYFFGNLTTDKNPGDGNANPGTTFTSATRGAWQETTCGIVSAFNPGDPLVVYSPNTTAAGTFDTVTGFYADV